MDTYIREIGGKWYAFGGSPSNAQVYSIGRDNPAKSSGGTCWCAKWTEEGIEYVASPSPSKQAAMQKARRAGRYRGITL